MQSKFFGILKKVLDFFSLIWIWKTPNADCSDLKRKEIESVTVSDTSRIFLPEIKSVSKQRYVWCLDNGHGKLTKGKRSPIVYNGQRLFEYEFNRAIVGMIIEELQRKNIQYYNVVPEIKIDDYLSGRVRRANKLKADLPKIYLSIHANAWGKRGVWESPNGIETWHFDKSASGKAIANIFQNELIRQTGWRDRGIKSLSGNRQFYVLKKTKMPAILTENGFYTNEEQCLQLMTDTFRKRIAKAHVNAILKIEQYGIEGIKK